MKLNIADPSTGGQKTIVIEDDRRLHVLMDKRMSQEVPGDQLGDEFKGYIFKITGGNDKQGFPMKQGVLVNHRVRLLLSRGHSCYRERRRGERRRKSVRGCIVSSDISALALVVVRKGEQEIPGVTDVVVPQRLGPKRASKIRKLFNLSKEDDVRQYVIRRTVPSKKEGRPDRSKAPKIQRLITPARIQRKRRLFNLKKKKVTARIEAESAYKTLLAARQKEIREKKMARKLSRQSSISKS